MSLYTSLQDYERSCDGTALSTACLQIDRGTSVFAHEIVDLDGLILRKGFNARTLVQDMRLANGWSMISLASDLNEPIRCGNVESPLDGVGLWSPSRDYTLVTPAGHIAFEIDISDELLASEGLVPELLRLRSMSSEGAMLELSKPASRSLTRALQHAMHTTGNNTSPTRRLDIRRSVLDVLARAFELAGAWESHAHSTPAHTRERVVRRARHVLEEHLTAPPRIETVARDLDVTVRTLQRCFVDALGTTPKQYSIALRLDRARRDLATPAGASSITEIAYRYGFSSASRFTEQFRRHFGESPSHFRRRASVTEHHQSAPAQHAGASRRSSHVRRTR